MPPSVLSTEGNAARFAEALEKRTGVPWIVRLVPCSRRNGGGFHIEPPPDRLKDGRMGKRDWGRLGRLFGALCADTRRWYLFPDELVAAFGELGIPIFSGRVENS